jgi:predicted SAM-dependent methyltransferase
MKVNIGCGSEILPGYVNLDIAKVEGVDVVHDLDVAPWPFSDGEVHEIRAWHVFEHVSDPILFMTEAHRVLDTYGVLGMQTPHLMSLEAFTDPTHKRFPTEHTWDYWIPGTALFRANNAAYGGVSFDRLVIERQGPFLNVMLRRR